MKRIMTVLLVIMLAVLGLAVYSYLNKDSQASAATTPEPTAEVTAQPTAAATAEPTATPDFTSGDSLLILANKSHKLPDGYVPSDLTWSVDCGTGACYMREPAAEALQEMFSAAAADGVNLTLLSAYRSEDYQATLYNGYVSSYGTERADKISSRPGYSDHQTGLAADIGSSTDSSADLNGPLFAATAEGQWLYEHAHEYGFIERYPDGKEEYTGYNFESWHYRYVGVETATAIYNVDPDETFEEYFNVSGGTTYTE
ncbi:MAG: M15 family metallopeptidase [Solobacterium sp.]|jgi:LAS superfamily LD-carboxypeptidase LdcB|nr:M15 family metallopeptidase [Solobacterium sp.]